MATCPPTPHLDEDDLDSLIGYLSAMKDRKDDPGNTADH